LVETAFGFHVIKITDKQDGIRLAVKSVMKASEATWIRCFTQATKFEMESADKGFDKVAKEMGQG
jgi:peptidyl-prolyl cis-trans isomerase D